jgi:hypothetical protein
MVKHSNHIWDVMDGGTMELNRQCLMFRDGDSPTLDAIVNNRAFLAYEDLQFQNVFSF